MNKTSNQRASALLVVLLALVIIAILFFLSMRRNDSGTGSSTKGFLKDTGLDTSSYKTTLESTKKVLKDAEATRQQVGN